TASEAATHGEDAGFVQLADVLQALVTMARVPRLRHQDEDLKLLPPEKPRMAADFVRRLKGTSEEDRQTAFARTSGCLSPEEADEMERVIEEGCEQVNEHGW
ncbi:MAG: hypothetical protein WBQ65_15940, partial [Bryobacteraceae bacterium]